MRRRAPLVAALVVAGIALALVAAGRGHERPPAARTAARHAAQAFLARYVAADGRVVRRDQGGDTVSEGQAYAMLLAVAIGDERRFARVWGWTVQQLRRPDGLLAWRWADGAVTDPQPAADADLDAARALVLAGWRFHRPAWARAGVALGRAVLRGETARVGRERVLVAGPWARSTLAVNPSYYAPRALRALSRASGDRGFEAVRRSGLRIVRALQAHRSGLAPDWARATPGGAMPTGKPGVPQAQAAYGLDAVRVPVRLAEACDGATRRQAAAPWRSLRRFRGGPPAVLDLGATPLVRWRQPAALAGAAGAAWAAGDRERASALLDAAERLDAAHPTYYGSAWVALARVMLTTRLLGGCQ